MVKGETIMPVPEGDITTSDILVPEVVQLEEAIVEADAEEAVEEYLPDEVVEK
jgi:hypothetical protein